MYTPTPSGRRCPTICQAHEAEPPSGLPGDRRTETWEAKRMEDQSAGVIASRRLADIVRGASYVCDTSNAKAVLGTVLGDGAALAPSGHGQKQPVAQKMGDVDTPRCSVAVRLA